eukprot:gene9856-51335_t
MSVFRPPLPPPLPRPARRRAPLCGGGAWVALAAGLAVQLCAGNIERVKEVMFQEAGDERGQSKLQTIALVGNVFTFMPLAGLWYDAERRLSWDLRRGGVSRADVGVDVARYTDFRPALLPDPAGWLASPGP